jgi:hypothetical protein
MPWTGPGLRHDTSLNNRHGGNPQQRQHTQPLHTANSHRPKLRFPLDQDSKAVRCAKVGLPPTPYRLTPFVSLYATVPFGHP